MNKTESTTPTLNIKKNINIHTTPLTIETLKAIAELLVDALVDSNFCPHDEPDECPENDCNTCIKKFAISQVNSIRNKNTITLERCGNCDNEVEIPDNKPSLCPECGEDIVPCSACYPPCWDDLLRISDKCKYDSKQE